MNKLIAILVIALLASAETLAASIAAKVSREDIAGLDVLVYATELEDAVFLRGALPAGDVFSQPSNPMIAQLVVGMLDKGTTRQDKFTLAQKLESLGASIEFNGGSHEITFSARCLKEDLPVVVALLAEQLRSPAFAPDELAKLKQRSIATIKRNLENPDSRAGEAFSHAVFPTSHPNRIESAETQLAGVQAATIDELKTFHAAHYGPARVTLVAAGDVDRAQLHQALRQAFKGWRGGTLLPPAPQPVRSGAAANQTVVVPGKASVSVMWGQATGLRYRDPDALALRVGTAILGSGFTGRLMANVRAKEGLTYGIGAALGADTFADGDWKITATFAPALVDKGIASTRRQLHDWYERGVTAEELAARKTNFIGRFQLGLATTDGVARTLLETVQRGYGPGWLDEYPRMVEALTLEQVNGAIRKYLDPQRMALVKAGTLE